MSLSTLQSKAAKHVAAKQAEAFLEPLLTYVDDDSVSAAEEGSCASGSTFASVERVKPSPQERLRATVVQVVVVGSAAAAVGAMVLYPVSAVIVSGVVAVAGAPYAAYKEQRIAKLPTLRGLNNKLREDAKELETAVDALAEEIDCLKPEAERAHVVEEELQDITLAQDRNVDALVDLVKENEQILSEMKDNLRQRIVQDVLGLVLASDRNRDGVFNEKETSMLVLKIQLQLNEYGVEFDEQKFRKIMGKGASIAQTVKIVKRLIPSMQEEESDSDKDDDEEEDYDMFHMSTTNSLSGSMMGGGAPSGDSAAGLAGLKSSLLISNDPSRSYARKGSTGSRAQALNNSLLLRKSSAGSASRQDAAGPLILPPSKDAEKQRRVNLGSPPPVADPAPSSDPDSSSHRSDRREKRRTKVKNFWSDLKSEIKEGMS